MIEGTARDVSRLLDHLGASRAAIHGISLGGYITFAALVAEPRLYSASVAMGSPDWTSALRRFGLGPGHPAYDRVIPICTAEDLLIMKMIAGRERDLLDIKELLQVLAGRTLDFAYLENWLGQFAEALEDPGLLQRFQEMRKAA